MKCKVIEVLRFVGGTASRLIVTPDGISIAPSHDGWVNVARYDSTQYRTAPKQLGWVTIPLDLAETARQKVENQEKLNRYVVAIRGLIENPQLE